MLRALFVRVGGIVDELDRLRVEERDSGAAYDDRYAEAEEARGEACQRYALPAISTPAGMAHVVLRLSER